METTMNGLKDQVRDTTRNFAQDVKTGSARVKRTASSEVNNLLQDVSDMLNKVGDVAGVDVAALRDRVQDRLSDAGGRFSSAAGQVSDMARSAAGATDDLVRDRPWQAIGAAVAFGAVLGILLARR